MTQFLPLTRVVFPDIDRRRTTMISFRKVN
jgi:hypothetical protein